MAALSRFSPWMTTGVGWNVDSPNQARQPDLGGVNEVGEFVPSGTFNSSARIVMMMASTPSLNVSSRAGHRGTAFAVRSTSADIVFEMRPR